MKEKIRKEYYPSKGFGKARNNVSKKVISDFKKISTSNQYIIDLLLYRVDTMLEYSIDFGEMDLAYYKSMISSFKEACKLIQKTKMETLYLEECRTLVGKSSPLWGIYDELDFIFYDCYGEPA